MTVYGNDSAASAKLLFLATEEGNLYSAVFSATGKDSEDIWKLTSYNTG